MTIVRINFERGAKVFRFHWKDGRIIAVGGAAIPEPAHLWFLPAGEATFAGYHIPTTRTSRLRFDKNSEGQARLMMLESRSVATRTTD